MAVALCRYGSPVSRQFNDEAALLAWVGDSGFEYEIREQRQNIPSGVAIRRVLWNLNTDRWDGDVVEVVS